MTTPEPFFRESGAGPAVVCTHSNASTSSQWLALMERLGPDFHVLAVDSYGAGKSPEWPSDRRIGLRDEVALIEPMLDRAGTPLVLVGHSYGAALALIAAWAAPDLRALRAGAYYEGDLLGAGAFAALLLAAPFAFPSVSALVTGRGSEVAFVVSGAEASWLVGVVGAAIGALVGLGLSSFGEREG